LGDCFFRHQVGALCRHPSFTVGRDAACGYDEVGVHMVAHVSCPGLDDTDEADVATDPLWVESEFLDGLGGQPKQQAIEEFLIAACEGSQLLRQGAGDQEVWYGQKQSLLSSEPAGGVVIAALRAVAVFA